MLSFFKKRSKVNKVDLLKKNVANAFSKVKEDTSILYQWIEYLSSQNQQLQLLIEQLKREVKILPKTDQEIKFIVDKYYSFNHLFSKLEELENRLGSVERGVSRRISVEESSPVKIKEPRQILQETIAKRISKNSKEYIKNILNSLITKYNNISGSQLKEMVVEEQKLCSKSSFYRLLEELEKEESITVFSSGKSKFFAVNLSSKN